MMQDRTRIRSCETPLGADDFSAVSRLLEVAFHDDEAMISLVGENKWHAIAAPYFELQFDSADTIITARETNVVSDTTDQLLGALVARSPRAVSSWRSVPAFFRLMWLLGRDYPASHQISLRIAEAIPEQPHWYINQLAVQPAHQSQGIASDLLRWFLDRVNQELVLVDCATELEPLYRRAGFRTIASYPDINLLLMAVNE